MKASTALSTRVRQLLASLHPPSPPTAQESRQLLNVLQSSFKRELDARHPNPLITVKDDHNIPIDRDVASAHATATHLNGILANSILGSLDGLHDENSAVSKFNKLAAESRIDVSRLAGLLKWHSRVLKSAGATPETAFGTRLDDWLSSSDASTRNEFFLNQDVLNAALLMLYAETNESILWKWLGMVYKRESINTTLQSEQWLSVEDRLVSFLMRIAISRGDTNDAAHQYLQACQYRIQSGRVTSTETEINMRSSGNRLASTIVFLRHTHGVTTDLFSKVYKYLPLWKTAPEISQAFCVLYSPTAPTAQMLYTNLRTDPDTLIARQKKASSVSRKAVMTALLDASKLSLDQGKRTQAAFLLDFAIDNYRDYLPARQVREIEPQLELSLNFVPG